ncbi:MAG: deoxyribose-phosphate aldolase [Candidatus Cloacimonetes bacterium HGW-Cloacimonetes-1]|jgi:deoxyribose-phosphate aldolase|nr:MAG: deoxyribose-phosphate aldolase [Candidatus Cloacimonetes bacterium HGW-Cloacimonetes-1]
MINIENIARDLFGSGQPCKCGGDHKVCLDCLVCRADSSDMLYEDQGIAHIVDATILRADATSPDVAEICTMALEYECASVCINSHFIAQIKGILQDKIKSCTVINFPLGAGDISAVAAEALAVIDLGINELDMVQNIAAARSGDWDSAYRTILEVGKLCNAHDVLLKVILETCFLTEEQIVISCLYAKKAGAHFVKTSTGFGSAGATAANIALMRATVGPKLGVKASGGVKTKEQANQMVAAGASRIGASSVSALKN